MSLAAIARALPEDFRIVLADIGSAGGLHRRWAPVRSHVLALLFDPLEPAESDEGTRYFRTALARAKGEVEIHVTRRASMTSMLRPNAPLLARFWDKPQHTEIVQGFSAPADSLDAVLGAAGLSVDAVKIDVQGGEGEVVAGAARALRESVFLAEIELSFFERYQGLVPFAGMVAAMDGLGFDLVDIGRIKRYRYANSFGVVNPGLGFGDRAGRLAFCDALFLLKDEILLARIAADRGGGLGLKAVLAALVHGKADLAAFLFDACGPALPAPAHGAIAAHLRRLKGRRHFGRKGWHRALDYLARRV